MVQMRTEQEIREELYTTEESLAEAMEIRHKIPNKVTALLVIASLRTKVRTLKWVLGELEDEN